MTLEGERPVESPSVDRVNGLEGVQVDIVMRRTPDDHVHSRKRRRHCRSPARQRRPAGMIVALAEEIG